MSAETINPKSLARHLSCSGRFVYSTFHDIGELMMEYYKEPNFTISGLESDTPKLDSGGFDYVLKKTYEGDNAVTLQTEPPPGDGNSIQTIQILKKSGTFVRTYMGVSQYFGSGELFHPEAFHFVIAQKGRCK